MKKFSEKKILYRNSGHGLKDEKKIRQQIVELSKKTGIPLVATNDAHYLTREDARAHEILLASANKKHVGETYECRKPEFYLRSAEEMWEFSAGTAGSFAKYGENCRNVSG